MTPQTFWALKVCLFVHLEGTRINSMNPWGYRPVVPPVSKPAVPRSHPLNSQPSTDTCGSEPFDFLQPWIRRLKQLG
jgi:hypothetical protein